jgi:hypothetical protein
VHEHGQESREQSSVRYQRVFELLVKTREGDRDRVRVRVSMRDDEIVEGTDSETLRDGEGWRGMERAKVRRNTEISRVTADEWHVISYNINHA